MKHLGSYITLFLSILFMSYISGMVFYDTFHFNDYNKYLIIVGLIVGIPSCIYCYICSLNNNLNTKMVIWYVFKYVLFSFLFGAFTFVALSLILVSLRVSSSTTTTVVVIGEILAILYAAIINQESIDKMAENAEKRNKSLLQREALKYYSNHNDKK